ncbi:DUF7340 domain-containing protein [Pseudoclavibacter sp. 13-3]|uniref:DUF7340 domain-containing protein n=1 Tax=Pseudoclavibacter sp. 13-3 TaxID=2901228 RepID=UPI001E37C2EA|nr:hypothetical protein [Pseudoclavibacter sp. 13-3]MCD7100462.1 hypothetical protein [Pseudoclavibacter sp. 13-3]
MSDFWELVDKLSAEHVEVLPAGHEPIRLDTGQRSRFVRVPGLLEQLESSVLPGRGMSGGAAQFSPLPVNALAMELFERLNHEISQAWRYAQVRPDAVVPFGDPGPRLREWAAAVFSDSDLVVVGDEHAGVQYTALGFVEHLVEQIESCLNPVRTEEITGVRCPACGQTHVVTTSAAGEEVRSWVLQVVKTLDGRPTGIQCRNPDCGASWRRDQFVLLAAALGCGPLSGLVAQRAVEGP